MVDKMHDEKTKALTMLQNERDLVRELCAASHAVAVAVLHDS